MPLEHDGTEHGVQFLCLQYFVSKSQVIEIEMQEKPPDSGCQAAHWEECEIRDTTVRPSELLGGKVLESWGNLA
jgi:hypothetical protein